MTKSFGIRLFSSIIILLVVGSFIALSSYAGIPGRIIAFIMMFVLGLYAFVEAVMASIKRYLFFLIFGVLSIALIFALDYNLLINVIKHPSTINNEFKRLFSWWTFIIPFLFIIPIIFLKNHDDTITTNNVFFVILLIILLTLFTKIIFVLAVIDWSLVLYVILIAIIFDTMAYVGGLTFGRKFIKFSFSPRLSPKKSWEGFIIGYVCSFIFAIAFGYFMTIFQGTSSKITWLIVASFILPAACQIGDLFFSSIKRTKNIKDFSKTIPGHGGIVDRIDGIIFVVIMFAAIYGVSLIGTMEVL